MRERLSIAIAEGRVSYYTNITGVNGEVEDISDDDNYLIDTNEYNT